MKIKIPEHVFDYSSPVIYDDHNIQRATVKNVTMYFDDENLLEKITGTIKVELKDGNVYKGKLIVGDEPGSVSIEMTGGMPVEDEEVLVELLQEDLMEASFEYENSDSQDDSEINAGVKPSDMQRLLSQVILSNRKKILRAGFLDTVKDKAGKLKRSVGRGLKVKSSQMDWKSYVEEQLANFCSAFVYDCYRYSILFDIYDDNMQEYGYEHATQKCLECVRDGYAEHIDSFLNKTSLKNSEEDEREKAKSVIDEAYSKMIKKVKIDLYSDGIKFWKDLKDLEPNATPNNLLAYESNGNFLAVLKKYLRPVEAYIGITRDSAGWKKRMEAFRE